MCVFTKIDLSYALTSQICESNICIYICKYVYIYILYILYILYIYVYIYIYIYYMFISIYYPIYRERDMKRDENSVQWEKR